MMTLFLSGCADLTAPEPARVDDGARTSLSGSPTTLYCPNDVAQSATGVIGPRGGAVSLGAHSVTFAPGAVGRAVHVTVHRPVGAALVLELTADGAHGERFHRAVEVVISHADCPPPANGLSAWAATDASGTELTEPLGGEHDPIARTVRFRTDHFSFFALAN